MTRCGADYLADALSERPVLTAPQQICVSLEDLVLDGTLRAGDRLPRVDEMAYRLGVSVPTASGALRTLREAGMLHVARGRNGGFVVAADALRAIAARRDAALPRAVAPVLDYPQLHEVREVQEVLAAGAAARHATAGDVAALERLLGGGVPDDAEAAFELDLAFHRAVAACTHNPMIMRFSGETVLALRALPRAAGFTAADVLIDLDAVTTAVARGDADGAAGAMHRHLRRSGDYYGAAHA